MYQPRTEHEEFGPGKKEFIICPDCGAVYYDKSWKSSIEGDLKYHQKNLEEKMVRVDELCPACKMKRDKVFEGEVVIKVKSKTEKGKTEDIEGLKKEILNNVKNTEKNAMEWDLMDRILWTEEKNDEIRIYTSENQLAVRIGKNLEKAFKNGSLEIKYSKGEDIIRVRFEI